VPRKFSAMFVDCCVLVRFRTSYHDHYGTSVRPTHASDGYGHESHGDCDAHSVDLSSSICSESARMDSCCGHKGANGVEMLFRSLQSSIRVFGVVALLKMFIVVLCLRNAKSQP
jgi:hypothetical protein